MNKATTTKVYNILFRVCDHCIYLSLININCSLCFFFNRKYVGISVASSITYDDGVDDGTDDFEREPYLVEFNVQNFGNMLFYYNYTCF